MKVLDNHKTKFGFQNILLLSFFYSSDSDDTRANFAAVREDFKDSGEIEGNTKR